MFQNQKRILWRDGGGAYDRLRGRLHYAEILRPARTVMALAPDGRLVVFSATRGTVTQLYQRDLHQADARPIPGTEGGSEPFFSPDGAWIGFTADNKITSC